MLRVQWEGPKDDEERLTELSKMRLKYNQERHLMGEDYYAACMNYIEKAEYLIGLRQGFIAEQEKKLQLAEETWRELGKTRPFAYTVVAQRLRDLGYRDWEVDKLVQYASFIQARGWEAFDPEDVAFLKKKYADAGVDAEKIEF